MSSGLSLTNRLLVATALTLLVFLGLVYFALEQAFVSSVTRTESEKLEGTILLVLAEAEDDGRNIVMPDVLQEARFNQLDSGLYGFIFDATGNEVWRSYSAIALEQMPSLARFRTEPVGEHSFGPLEVGEDGFLYASMGISWELDPDEAVSGGDGVGVRKANEYTISILQSADFFYSELEQFRQGLLVRLFGVAAMLLVVQLLVLRLGLLPLKRLTTDVQRVEQGEISELSGQYPKELQGLTDNLNQLLVHEQQQREQYKHRLGDLAHSLKTPLSIASGALLDGAKDRDLLAEQLQNMDQIVQYQLQRASRAGPAITQQSVSLAPLIQRLGGALQKVYASKGMELQLSLDDEVQSRMDESDLMELLGNILDNAFKYGDALVSVKTFAQHGKPCVLIADDGPGIPVDEREHIFARGQRLDTQRPGQGIGLAVVNDIAASYQIDITISEATQGGALFHLILPG